MRRRNRLDRLDLELREKVWPVYTGFKYVYFDTDSISSIANDERF